MGREHRLAFIFPGQGTIPRILPPPFALGTRLFDQAVQAGLRLQDWIEEGDEDRLRRTQVAQPASSRREGCANAGLFPQSSLVTAWGSTLPW